MEPPVLPVGREAAAHRGRGEERISGSRDVTWFYNSFHPLLLILVTALSPLSPVPEVTRGTFRASAGWFLTSLTPSVGFSFLWSASSIPSGPSLLHLPQSYYCYLFACSCLCGFMFFKWSLSLVLVRIQVRLILDTGCSSLRFHLLVLRYILVDFLKYVFLVY